MAQLAVFCGCGGHMIRHKPDSEQVRWYVCSSCDGHVRLEVESSEIPNSARCGVRFASGERCGTPLPAGAMLCGSCGEDIINGALDQPEWRSWTARRIAAWQVRKAELDIIATEREQALEEQQRKEARRRAAKADTSAHVVYYARTGDDQIKIGTTGDLPRRMREFRIVNPANVLAAEPGGHQLERDRHQQFAKERWNRRTEDFSDSPALLLHIDLIREEHGDPYALAVRLLADREGRGLESA